MIVFNLNALLHKSKLLRAVALNVRFTPILVLTPKNVLMKLIFVGKVIQPSI